MNRGQLKDRLLKESHRNDSDLVQMLDQFVNDAEERINHRFGLTLQTQQNLDSNYVMDKHYLLYLYAGMHSLNVYIKDFDEAANWMQLWRIEAAQMNINNLQANQWVNPPLAVRSEYETAVIEAAKNGT